MKRLAYQGLGLLLVAIGLIGTVVPLLPTTIFLILAAGCFARSSPRLETWLVEHPRLGPPLVAWRMYGAISRPAKVSACIGMTIGYVLFWLGAHPDPWLAILVAAFMAASAAYVLTRPGLPPQQPHR
ncbi:YbaN family protein [Leptospira interrogans]